MQYIIRYDVKPKASESFRSWLVERSDDFQNHARSGWTYLGTWFTVQGFGSYGTETRWEVEDYGALGAEHDATGVQLINEWMDFVDHGRPIETYLMKTAEDVIIIDGT